MKKTEKNRQADILQRQVNGYTADRSGQITKVHFMDNYYLDTRTAEVSNQYSKDKPVKVSRDTVKAAVQKAREWQSKWSNCHMG